jgi:hypothetical protein
MGRRFRSPIINKTRLASLSITTLMNNDPDDQRAGGWPRGRAVAEIMDAAGRFKNARRAG